MGQEGEDRALLAEVERDSVQVQGEDPREAVGEAGQEDSSTGNVLPDLQVTLPSQVPDEEVEEEAVRIVSSKQSDRRQRLEEAAREREGVEKVAKELREVREEARELVLELKSYNAFLPAGVLEVPQGGSVTALLKVRTS